MNKIKEAFPEFEKPSLAIDTIIIRTKDTKVESNRQVPLKQMQVLLISEKGKNQWHLPGTMLRLGETPKDAISRIVKDKVNISDIYFEQLYTVADNPLRDERGHIVSIVYTGIVNNKHDIVISDNNRFDFGWFWITKEDKHGKRLFIQETTEKSIDNLMYDHVTIVKDTINRLKNKLLYTDIGFNLVEDKFTIKELENSFEAINERNIPGFRRIISNKVEGTGIMSDGKAFRPAELYKKKG